MLGMGVLTVSCSDKKEDEPEVPVTPNPGEPTPTPPASVAPEFDPEIKPFDTSTRATDSYTHGSDNDIYWQANTFPQTVKIVYDGATATVTSSSNNVKQKVSGAHVALNISGQEKTAIELSGSSDNGSLKIYANAKVMLTLDNLDLASKTGPVINNQSKKRMFIVLKDGSVNKLVDSDKYEDDHYYVLGSDSETEDRKGAVFSEDHIVFSGNGLLQVTGNNKHAIASDGAIRILPGITIDAETAKGDAIRAKGSNKQQCGVTVDGGYIYALCSGDGGKCINSDMNIFINAGTLSLNNSSNTIFDTKDNGTSSGAGIKSNGNINISGGNITIKTTGDGAKGLNADNSINIEDGTLTVTSTGKRYEKSATVSASPSGLKADNTLNIKGGIVNVAMLGEETKSDGIEADLGLTISGGQVYCDSYGNAFFAKDKFKIVGGYVYASGKKEEAIKSNNTINITGGYVLAQSPALPKTSVKLLKVSGATVIAFGGNVMTNLDTQASPTCKVFNDITLAADEPFAVISSAGKGLFAAKFATANSNVPLMIASPSFTKGSKWTLATGGTIAGSTSPWNGYYSGCTLTNPKTALDFSF